MELEVILDAGGQGVALGTVVVCGGGATWHTLNSGGGIQVLVEPPASFL